MIAFTFGCPITDKVFDVCVEKADTVMGQTGKACLVTLTDRKSRYLLCKKIAKKNSFLVKQAMIELLENSFSLSGVIVSRG